MKLTRVLILNRLTAMVKIEEGNIELYERAYHDIYKEARIKVAQNKIKRLIRAKKYVAKLKGETLHWTRLKKMFGFELQGKLRED